MKDHRFGLESLENRELFAVDVFGMLGDVPTENAEVKQWFVADSFSFGVEREMKESGEKGAPPTSTSGWANGRNVRTRMALPKSNSLK